MAMTDEEKAVKAEEKAKLAAEKAAAKAEEKAEKAATKAAEKAAAKAEKAEKPAKIPAVSQNGVSRPTRGLTLYVWETADRLSGEKKEPATRREVVAACSGQVPEIGTVHTQYGRWRKFHGLVAIREAKVVPESVDSVEAEVADEYPIAE